ncbi:DUF3095 family protein [Lacibacterium aquatile]|uniref:DUF3095 family protein n=1 Tax=Lacibacterium aquatile TaxID=1168082 RepID=A0ABW5DK56_9PROT
MSDLPLIDRFDAATDPARYRRLPPDWALAVSDIVGSTKKVQSGRYRDVNFVAAAVIAAIQAEVAKYSPHPVACQFGGDGATLAIPPEARAGVERTLAALGYWSQNTFDLELRVGLVSVAEIEAAGGEVLAALYDAGQGNYYGMFLGAGASIADRLLKSDAGHQLVPQEGPLDGLDGLSCRWEPINSRKGTILCLMADPVAEDASGAHEIEVLRAAIDAIAAIDEAAPLGDGSNMVPRLRSMIPAAWKETLLARSGARLKKLASVALEVVLMWGLYRLDRGIGRFNPRDYRGAVARQTDFRRVATGLRLVIDVSLDQAERIEALLEERTRAGTILYGSYRAPAATITCLVGKVVEGKHIHFVDGDGLGFWQAAKAYKARRAALVGAT